MPEQREETRLAEIRGRESAITANPTLTGTFPSITAAFTDRTFLLAAIDARDGLLNDMAIDATPAIEAERQRVLDAICPHFTSARRGQVLADLGGGHEALSPDSARREIDTLRAALRKIINLPPGDRLTIARIDEARNIARNALGLSQE